LDWDKKLRGKHQKILLLQDNFSGHIVLETLTNIQVINFEPNLTAHVTLLRALRPDVGG